MHDSCGKPSTYAHCEKPNIRTDVENGSNGITNVPESVLVIQKAGQEVVPDAALGWNKDNDSSITNPDMRWDSKTASSNETNPVAARVRQASNVGGDSSHGHALRGERDILFDKSWLLCPRPKSGSFLFHEFFMTHLRRRGSEHLQLTFRGAH